MNESCRTYEWVMSHRLLLNEIWEHLRVYHMCMSSKISWVMRLIWMGHVTRMNESCHTYEWDESCRTYEWVMLHRLLLNEIWKHLRVYHMCISSKLPYMNKSSSTYKWVMSHLWFSRATRTGWRRLIGYPKLQIILHKGATKYRSLLRKMTYKDKGSYESSPPCMRGSHIYACHCNTLQHIGYDTNVCGVRDQVLHCNTLQYTATHCSWHRCMLSMWQSISLQHTATHCNTLQHTATHCNTLFSTQVYVEYVTKYCTVTHCNTLQHIVRDTGVCWVRDKVFRRSRD